MSIDNEQKQGFQYKALLYMRTRPECSATREELRMRAPNFNKETRQAAMDELITQGFVQQYFVQKYAKGRRAKRYYLTKAGEEKANALSESVRVGILQPI